MTIRDSGSTNVGSGGAIFYYGTANGSLSNASLAFRDVDFVNNTAGQEGGAISMYNGVLTMTDCDVRDNSVTGGSYATGGGVTFVNGDIHLEGTTFEGNRVVATAADNAWAGARRKTEATPPAAAFTPTAFSTYQSGIRPSRTTQSKCAADRARCRTPAPRAALPSFTSSHTFSAVNSTFASNSVTGDPHNTFSNAVKTGGLFVDDAYQLQTTLLNNIVADNRLNPDASGHGVASDLGYAATLFTAKNNLVGNGDGLSLDSSNLVGTAASPLGAGLLAAADNGGPTRTMALAANSPAIDAGLAAGSTPSTSAASGAWAIPTSARTNTSSRRSTTLPRSPAPPSRPGRKITPTRTPSPRRITKTTPCRLPPALCRRA